MQLQSALIGRFLLRTKDIILHPSSHRLVPLLSQRHCIHKETCHTQSHSALTGRLLFCPRDIVSIKRLVTLSPYRLFPLIPKDIISIKRLVTLKPHSALTAAGRFLFCHRDIIYIKRLVTPQLHIALTGRFLFCPRDIISMKRLVTAPSLVVSFSTLKEITSLRDLSDLSITASSPVVSSSVPEILYPQRD